MGAVRREEPTNEGARSKQKLTTLKPLCKVIRSLVWVGGGMGVSKQVGGRTLEWLECTVLWGWLEFWLAKDDKVTKGFSSQQVMVNFKLGWSKRTRKPAWSVWAWMILRWFCPNKIGQASPGTTSILKVEALPFSQMMGTCKLPMALSWAWGFATETGNGVDNSANCIAGWTLQIASACAWLTKDKLQQESKGKGSGISAEVIRVHRMFLLARSRSEMCKLLGTAVIAGLPNAGAWDKISCALWGFEADADWGRASSLSMRVVNDCM